MKEHILAALRYEPETGNFYWAQRVAIAIAVGDRAGRVGPKGYRILRFKGMRYQEHRLAHLFMTGDWPSGVIDHINGAKDDNRWSNLRDVSISMNQQNRRGAQSNNRLGVHGVSMRNGRFAARIKVAGKLKWLGSHEKLEQAIAAVNAGKREHHSGAVL
jgi:hypothetical protein